MFDPSRPDYFHVGDILSVVIGDQIVEPRRLRLPDFLHHDAVIHEPDDTQPPDKVWGHWGSNVIVEDQPLIEEWPDTVALHLDGDCVRARIWRCRHSIQIPL